MRRYQTAATQRYRVVVIVAASRYRSEPIEVLARDEWNACMIAMLKHPKMSLSLAGAPVTFEVETLPCP